MNKREKYFCGCCYLTFFCSFFFELQGSFYSLTPDDTSHFNFSIYGIENKWTSVVRRSIFKFEEYVFGTN